MTASTENKIVRLARITYSLVFGVFWYHSPLNKFREMKLLSEKEILGQFQKGKSIARFGDGELRIMENVPSDFYQKSDEKLASDLIAVTKNKDIIVCFPKPLKTLKGLTLSAKLFWISNIYWNRKSWKKYIDIRRAYGNTQITRPYMDYKNKAEAKEKYKNLKKVWQNEKICIIEGEKTHLGEGNDLFNNTKSIKRILAPAKNAYDQIDKIFHEAQKVPKDYIFLIALGPTATVLVSKLAKVGRRAFDIGHVDIEYEWMLGGVKRKSAIPGKAVNESRGNKNMAARVINAARQIKPKDILAPFIFLFLLIPSFIFRTINKLKRRKLWLIAEEGQARDNGYHFYKYIREDHPRGFYFYAIKPNSAGYEKVAKLGNIVKWGSLKHWLYYMSANLNISSQKSGNPCAIFWYFIHVTLGLYRNRVFLQHGITHNTAKWLYPDKTKFRYVVCGAKKEKTFFAKEMGYKEEQLILSGFPRWDNLTDQSKNQKSILIMPTWRKWLGEDRNKAFEVKDFERSEYYQNWNGLLNDPDFVNYVEEDNIEVYFYPHIQMQKFLSSFESPSKNIRIVSTDTDIQKYFNQCNIMITDYSSVAFDFAYLGKPVIYYQFDEKIFRTKQYAKGYFDFQKDGFGPVASTKKEAISAIKQLLDKHDDDKYTSNITKFFGQRIQDCSKLLYGVLSKDYQIPNKKAKISIIAPAYNAEKYVSRCIKSITPQDYKDWELIIVDDESSDDTVDIATSFNDARIKVLKQKHGGPNAARRRGLNKATGDYIMFVDIDDCLAPGSLTMLINKFSVYDVDVIRFNAVKTPEEKNCNNIISNNHPDIIITNSEIYDFLTKTYKLNSLCSQIYKRNLFTDERIFNQNVIYGEDLLANIVIHQNTKNMLITNETAYYYYDNPTSTTHNQSLEYITRRITERVAASIEVMKWAETISLGNNPSIQYAQIKMIRDSILQLNKKPKLKKKDFIQIIYECFLHNETLPVNKKKLKQFVKKQNLIERIKNSHIIMSIAYSDYNAIWKYFKRYRLYSNLMERGK
ncbi:DUF1792 domain-containing protein [Candidatus Saccharibacteria bacterium]|nr:DUF1792 domain-containing protein [Candidatus Saccharibacteria bacterium]